MKRRQLGHTDLHISEIGFGCGPTAGLMIQNDAPLRERVIARALALGIDYFDTAPGYGSFASETNLGAALQALGAKPVVATKVALSAGDLADIAGAVVRSVRASLTRLRLATIPLIQLHNRVGPARAAKADLGNAALLSVDDVLGPGGVVEGFEALRREGLVRHFGCSAFGGDMACVERLIDSGRFAALIASYSVANPSAWDPVRPGGLRDYAAIGRHAATAGLGVIGLRALEGGALLADPAAATLDGRPWVVDQQAAAARAAAQRRVLGQPAEEFAQTAIRFALSQARLATVLIGFSDLAQVEAAVTAADAGPLPADLIDRLARII